MTDPRESDNGASTALLASIRVRVWLGGAAVLVLAAGLLLRPDTPAATAAIEETPAPILQDVVSRREAQTLVRQLQVTAREAAPFAVRVTLPEPAAARWSDWEEAPPVSRERYGVVLAEREVLAHVGDVELETPVSVTLGDGRRFAGRIVERWRERGLGRIAVDAAAPLAVPPAAAAAAPGDAVVATAPGVDGMVIAPLFVAAVGEEAVLVSSAIDRFHGMPVFGGGPALVGVIAMRDDGMAVLPLAAATAAPPGPAPASRRLGLSLGTMPSPDAGGASRVIVTAVAPDGPAADAGVRAGDVLFQVDETDVEALAGAVTALSAGPEAAIRLRVRRGRQLLTLRVTPADAAATP